MKLIEKCKVIEFTENAARGTFSYGPMKRKPVITAMATIVNTPITFDATLRDRLNERSFQFEKLQPNTTYNMSIASAYGFTKTQPCLTTFTTLTKLEPPYEMMIRKVSNDSFSLRLNLEPFKFSDQNKTSAGKISPPTSVGTKCALKKCVKIRLSLKKTSPPFA